VYIDIVFVLSMLYDEHSIWILLFLMKLFTMTSHTEREKRRERWERERDVPWQPIDRHIIVPSILIKSTHFLIFADSINIGRLYQYSKYKWRCISVYSVDRWSPSPSLSRLYPLYFWWHMDTRTTKFVSLLGQQVPHPAFPLKKTLLHTKYVNSEHDFI